MKKRLPPLTVLAFLLPNILGFLAFTLFPVLLSLFMAFTNWTLKPAVGLEFVGLRNFTDLLAVQAVSEARPGLWAAYSACAALLAAGVVSFLWANLRGWPGTKLGGGVLVAIGLATILIAVARQTSHGFVLAGLLAALCGIAVALRGEGEWKPGVGTLPPLLILACVVGLWRLNAGMWEAYEPRDARFWKYLYNTLYLMLGIPFSVAGSLCLALLLNNRLPRTRHLSGLAQLGLCLVGGTITMAIVWGLGYPNVGLLLAILWLIAGLGLAFNVVAYRTVYYLPAFTAGVAIMVLWKALYNPQTGPLSIALASLTGLDVGELPTWLASYVWSKPSLMVMGVWIGIGGTNMLLYLAALTNIPQDLLDAAQVDGAGRWAQFRHVTWPQLAPTTFFISIMSVIGGLQGGFEQARVMTAGGPDGATTTLSYYLYNTAFQDLDLGYAAAIAWVMFAIIFIVTALNWKFGKELEVG